MPNLDTAAIAALINVTPATIATYRVRHAGGDNPCPEPAGHIGGHPYWTDPKAWTAWSARRPGRVGRPRKVAP